MIVSREQITAGARALVDADTRYQHANGERQRLWRDDRPGRRARGAEFGSAKRQRENAMRALIRLIKLAPADLTAEFNRVGPTYYEAAKAWCRRYGSPALSEGRPA